MATSSSDKNKSEKCPDNGMPNESIFKAIISSSLLKSIAGKDNIIIHRFLQAIAVILALSAIGFVLFIIGAFIIAILSYLYTWYGALLILIGIILIALNGKIPTKGSQFTSPGIVVLFIGILATIIHVSVSIYSQQREKETQLANEQAASHVKIAQDYFDKGQLDKAQSELKQIGLITRASDTKAADALQDSIQKRFHNNAVFDATMKVREYVRQAELDFSNDTFEALDAAEENLSKALAVQNATEIFRAKELLANISVRRKELANQQVAKMLITATDFFKTGKFEKALQIANEALTVKYSTERQETKQLIRKIWTAQPELLLRDTQNVISQEDYSIIVKCLKDYIENPHSNQKPKAKKLLRLLEIVVDENKAQSILKSMSNGQISSMMEKGTLSDDLKTENTFFNDAAKMVLCRYASQELNLRKELMDKMQKELAISSAKDEEIKESEFAKKEKAWIAAEIIVKEHLITSPSTASFGWQTSESCVTALGGGKYLVKGWVDAQNLFGATVRTEFSMKMHGDDKGNWHGEDFSWNNDR